MQKKNEITCMLLIKTVFSHTHIWAVSSAQKTHWMKVKQTLSLKTKQQWILLLLNHSSALKKN